MKKFLSVLFLLPCIPSIAQIIISPDAPETPKEPAPFGIRITKKIPCPPVSDQSSSPTCWVFGTNSFFESNLMRRDKAQIDLSEMFIARLAYIDKAKKYVASGGKTYAAGGGQFRDIFRVISRYGMVPESAYTGRVKGELKHNHSKLDTTIKRYLQALVKKKQKQLTAENIAYLNKVLDEHLGKLPFNFFYGNKYYTPKSFARDVVKFNADDYVEVASFADHPYYRKLLFADKFNWAGDSLYNVSLSDMQEITDTAIAKGFTVGWEGDVTEPGFETFRGLAWTYDTTEDFDAKRLADFRSEKTERDHMLHLVGTAADSTGKKWYYLKNSWGTWINDFGGYLYMNDEYYRLKTLILLVNKEALPVRLKRKLGLR